MTSEQNLPELSSGTLGGAIAAAKSSAAKNGAEGTDGTKNRSRSRGSRGGRGRGPKKDAAQNGMNQAPGNIPCFKEASLAGFSPAAAGNVDA